MVQQAVMELESATASCTGFIVNICLSYGGRAEIVSAAQKLTSQVLDGKLAVAEITEETFSNNLLTKDLPGNIRYVHIHCSLCYCTIAPWSLFAYLLLFAFHLTICSLMSDPDILIRTSGEYRLSNFLIWQVITVLE